MDLDSPRSPTDVSRSDRVRFCFYFQLGGLGWSHYVHLQLGKTSGGINPYRKEKQQITPVLVAIVLRNVKGAHLV